MLKNVIESAYYILIHVSAGMNSSLFLQGFVVSFREFNGASTMAVFHHALVHFYNYLNGMLKETIKMVVEIYE
jgi:hypothetical protein